MEKIDLRPAGRIDGPADSNRWTAATLAKMATLATTATLATEDKAAAN